MNLLNENNETDHYKIMMEIIGLESLINQPKK